MPENYFDEPIATTYEARWPELFDPAVVDPVVRFLAELAGGGAALELGIGTGRIAIPLSRRGVRVHGIDLSPDMVAQLRTKPGTEDIGVTIGDFATTSVGGRFTLAYLVRNTIMNLTTQEQQVSCFQNVAAQLEPGGRFVIEVVVPGLQREVGWVGRWRGGGLLRFQRPPVDSVHAVLPHTAHRRPSPRAFGPSLRHGRLARGAMTRPLRLISPRQLGESWVTCTQP